MAAYTVTRGKRYNSTYPAYYAEALLDPTSGAILILAKEIRESGRNHYGGAFYTVKFRVDRAICVTGVSFWGPITQDNASYDVELRVFEPVKKQIFPLPDTRNQVFNLHQLVENLEIQDEPFKVTFDQPLPLKPGTWYLIQFKLEGPDTVRCRKTFLRQAVKTDKGDVNFQFSEGSNQLPQMHFTLN